MGALTRSDCSEPHAEGHWDQLVCRQCRGFVQEYVFADGPVEITLNDQSSPKLSAIPARPARVEVPSRGSDGR